MMTDRILLGVLYLSGQSNIYLSFFFFTGWPVFTMCIFHQYHYVPDLKTWTEAQSYCTQTYTNLATVESTEEMNQLINTVSSAGYNSEVWIGLYSQINWTWSDAAGRRHIVKLRMRLEDSSEDLNDPAVKADMLKKVSLQNFKHH
uniref:C-type lectin domain-containing protein n=1 Tax=Anabas testudineus TaxID=64144 RepID=A0A7N6A4N0_ANATE